ncbi:hypothetical protein [Micromonospora sp. NPDC047740]|uniref:hypothetical protein n=1 Tax=Micromonospora sp. NPDC047740 TaxID=3364254 RepID=UPI00370F9F4D
MEGRLLEPEFPELAWLYPEVGSLAAALRRAAAEIGVDVGDVTANESNPKSYAGVASVVPEREALGVSVGHVERYFSVGGWGQGVELLTGSTDDLAEVARLAQAWRVGLPLVEIQRLAPFVRVNERALAHERGPEHVVAYQWHRIATTPSAATPGSDTNPRSLSKPPEQHQLRCLQRHEPVSKIRGQAPAALQRACHGRRACSGELGGHAGPRGSQPAPNVAGIDGRRGGGSLAAVP